MLGFRAWDQGSVQCEGFEVVLGPLNHDLIKENASVLCLHMVMSTVVRPQ